MQWLRFILNPPATPRKAEKPEKNPSIGVHFDTEWAHGPVARLTRSLAIYGFFKPATKLYASPRIIGLDRIRGLNGPTIFAANHHSHADTSLMLSVLPNELSKNLAIAAGADYFFPNRVLSVLSALLIGAIPIERTRLSKLSIDNSVKSLTQGRHLLIFPEGGRSPDGWRQEHRPGAAFLAKRAKVPVVPIYLDGTGDLLPKGKNWPKRTACAVVFGSPMQIEPGEDPRKFAKRIELRIGELAEEFESGWWRSRQSAYAQKTTESTQKPSAWRRRWELGKKPTKTTQHKPWPKQ